MPVLRRRGRRVIDLSADYRLRDASLYTTWYKAPHVDAEGLAEAVYGLPELHRKAIAQAGLVASPGCYPMGAILATAPLLKSGFGLPQGIVIDGQSGVTGAGAQGRTADPMYLYTEANENVQAYSIATHRHPPEIELELSALCGPPVVVSFTPHPVPLHRGLFTTASVPLGRLRAPRISRPYREFYAGEPFVRSSRRKLPTTRRWWGQLLRRHRRGGPAQLRCAVSASTTARGLRQRHPEPEHHDGWDERSGLEAPPVYP